VHWLSDVPTAIQVRASREICHLATGLKNTSIQLAALRERTRVALDWQSTRQQWRRWAVFRKETVSFSMHGAKLLPLAFYRCFFA